MDSVGRVATFLGTSTNNKARCGVYGNNDDDDDRIEQRAEIGVCLYLRMWERVLALTYTYVCRLFF